MSSSGYGGGGGGFGLGIGPASTPQVIKDVMMVTAAAFLVQSVLQLAFSAGNGGGHTAVIQYGALWPEKFWSGMLWQPLTTLLLHGEVWHLVGNMFFLWMFGCPVAERLGRERFLAFYVGAGVGCGLLNLVFALCVHSLGYDISLFPWDTPTIGASGAVFAVLTFYCFSWPDRTISLLFVPLTFTARWLLPLEFLMEFSSDAGPDKISHAAHLCGVAMGWLWFRSGGINPFAPIFTSLRRFKSRRSSHLKVVGEDKEKDSGPVFH